MKRKKVILGTLAVVGSLVTLAIIFAVLFGVQTAAVFYFKKSQDEAPELYAVPRELQMRSEATSAGRRLSLFGYELETPWTAIEKENANQFFIQVAFKSGKGVIVFNPAQAVDLIDEFRENNPEYADEMVSLFGRESMKSDYALYQSILNATPDQLSVFMSQRDTIRLSILLILKSMVMASFESEMYAFEYRDLRGFQFGNPARSDKVFVLIFDRNDRKVELLFFAPKDAATRLSQDEITHVIQNLRPVGDIQG